VIALLLALVLGPAPEAIPRGKLVGRVVCQGSASQSYALYLPSN
jgi:hypothetical protein